MDTFELLTRCYPFHQLSLPELRSIKSEVDTRECKRGQTIVRRTVAQSDKWTYLLGGSAEMRRSFFDRETLQAGSDTTLQPLEYLLLSDGGQIVAQDDCVIAQVSRNMLDRSLAATASVDYNVSSLHDAGAVEEQQVGSGAVDWMSRFLHSSFAQNLPAASIQKVLIKLEHIDVANGEIIVRKGEVGDSIYIVTRGVATVCTDENSAFGGREIALLPGDYFGEESLVADTLRNATVKMAADGAVAKMSQAVFDELVRPHIVREADDALMERCLNAVTDKALAILDVRFPIEFRQDALPESTNIPITLLRSRLSILDNSRIHLVTRHGGRRSELAVFLLRQAGIEAYLMAPMEHRLAHVEVFDRDSFGERTA